MCVRERKIIKENDGERERESSVNLSVWIVRMPYLYRSLSAKEPCNGWLFCGDLNLSVWKV